MSDSKPWDVKTLTLSLDYECFVTIEVFNDDLVNIYEGDQKTPDRDPVYFVEGIDLDAARRLRDFLNYAIK